jgi:protein arginine kinase activator
VKCQICKQRESVLHVQQIIGEQRVDVYLCETCANEKGIAKMDDNIELSLAQLLTGLFSVASRALTPQDREICEVCGTTVQVMRKEGRLGCPECYASFGSEVRSVLRKLAGSATHSGKLPRKLREYQEQIVDRQELQSRLEEAIEQEDYEVAAALRDRIRMLDGRAGE